MSGVLALVGGNEWTEGCTFDRSLLDAGGGGPVVVLPTAAAYEHPDKKGALAAEWFGGLGAEVRVLDVLTRRDALDEDAVRQVHDAAVVYLSEGGSMHLRSVLKDTPLFDALLACWDRGGVLAGSGAGADVLCDPMVDPRGGAFTVGLGVVSGLAIIPRYDTWSREKVHRTVELAPAGVTVVGVPQATAIIRAADGAWSAEGAGDVDVFVDGKAADVDSISV